MRICPASKWTFEAQPAMIRRYSGRRSWKKRCYERSSSRLFTRRLAFPELPDLFGDVDPDGAPRDAPPAPRAAAGVELVPPGGELVADPLPVAAPGGVANAAAVQVRVLKREAGIPGPPPFRVLSRQIADVLDIRAEAGGADQGAVGAGQAPLGDVVPAGILPVAGEELADPPVLHLAPHGGLRPLDDAVRFAPLLRAGRGAGESGQDRFSV